MPDPRFGTGTSLAAPGVGTECTMGSVWLVVGSVAGGTPAAGQTLAINQNLALFALLGTSYGGDGRTTFKLPDLRSAAPNGLTYVICTRGVFPARESVEVVRPAHRLVSHDQDWLLTAEEHARAGSRQPLARSASPDGSATNPRTPSVYSTAMAVEPSIAGTA
ncbi:hypothetical protein Pth03_33080 [Planotetraspora thailandica]|uniref:Phage tail collar domain-containing protein n=1 Tax=Planotetraspora thailandica TaxID=487172 RepID=A0A8J3XW09_9ACTN|nr:hypothetical protein Pth03_33080 [Planotetraspora thailandica]